MQKIKVHKNRINSRFERGVVKLDEYKSFEEVYIEYDKLVFKVAKSYFKDPEIAREITNDVWVEYAEALRKTRRNFFDRTISKKLVDKSCQEFIHKSN